MGMMSDKDMELCTSCEQEISSVIENDGSRTRTIS